MEKVFAGQGKVKTFKWGSMMSMLFFKDDIETLLANLNDKGCVTLDIKERKTVSEKGFSHYGQLFIQSERTDKPADNAADDDNLPF